MDFNHTLYLETVFASILIIISFILKNSLIQLKLKNDIFSIFTMILFFGGWLLIGYLLGKDREMPYGIYIGTLLIIISCIMMNQMKANNTSNIVLSILFSFGWLLIGHCVGNHLDGMIKYVGMIASVLVILTMIYILPYQRKNNIVDGPGMPMYVIAWGIIAYMNAIKR